MTETDKTIKFTSANREAWEEVAPIHRKHNQAELLKEFSNTGYSCLDQHETEILTKLKFQGKDVAQVCANNARELLSVKNMGAGRCVAFDGAQSFLDQGQELADAAGQEMEFVCCDIYDIDPIYHRQFDLVTITIGVLGWMPDIDRFFASIEMLVKPGGEIFIYEQHPILDMIKPAGADEPIEWELSYFNDIAYVEEGGLDYFGGETYEAKPVTSFTHKMSDVFMAALKSGLQIEHFEELPQHISNTWWNVEKLDIGLPMCFTLVLRKPR